jgi:hypothetical protein
MRAFICDKCKKVLKEEDEKYFLVSSKFWDFDTRKGLYPRSDLCGECYRKLARFIFGGEEE